MEKKVIADGALGTVGHYELAFENAELQFSVSAKVGPVQLKTSVTVNSVEMLDEIAAAIPGKLDDAVIGVAKAALLGK